MTHEAPAHQVIFKAVLGHVCGVDLNPLHLAFLVISLEAALHYL